MKAIIRNSVFGLFVLPLATAWAVPVGYSVNSDEPDGDKLFRIDLANGSETVIGTVESLGVVRSDIEGLAFDRNGVLWAVDDESLMIFPVDTTNAQVSFNLEASISGLAAIQGNDFGLTFTCEDEAYVSTVTNETLYRLDVNGTATEIGNLGARISAIAAWGKPARLYGLGNGQLGVDGPADNRSLYEIDIETGAAQLIGEIGDAADDYFEAGLSFDHAGVLWAITDRWTLSEAKGSQILTLDLTTGKASLQSTTSVTGFESLAVAPPAGCDGNGPIGVGQFPLFEGIPTLSDAGKLLAFLLLGFIGLTALRRRTSA